LADKIELHVSPRLSSDSESTLQPPRIQAPKLGFVF
jgi:hypothetical protein